MPQLSLGIFFFACWYRFAQYHTAYRQNSLVELIYQRTRVRRNGS